MYFRSGGRSDLQTHRQRSIISVFPTVSYHLNYRWERVVEPLSEILTIGVNSTRARCTSLIFSSRDRRVSTDVPHDSETARLQKRTEIDPRARHRLTRGSRCPQPVPNGDRIRRMDGLCAMRALWRLSTFDLSLSRRPRGFAIALTPVTCFRTTVGCHICARTAFSPCEQKDNTVISER